MRIGIAPPRLVRPLIEASAERRTRAGEDDHPYRAVGVGLLERVMQLGFQIGRERVHARGTIERDGGDALFDGVDQVLIGHVFPL